MKNRRYLLIILICFVPLFLVAGLFRLSAFARPELPCDISGTIAVDSTWNSVNCDYYILSGAVTVASGVTLTIEPGTLVKFNSFSRLTVDGKLQAIGTANNHIVFTSNSVTPAGGDWGPITFTSNSPSNPNCDNSGSILQFSTIEYGGGTSPSNNGAIRVDGTSPCLDHNLIHNNADGIFVLNNGLPLVTNNVISGNGALLFQGHGLSMLASARAINASIGVSITVTGNEVVNNKGTGINVQGPVPGNISGNKARQNGGYGFIFIIGGNSNLENNEATENALGGFYGTIPSGGLVRNNNATNNNGGFSITIGPNGRIEGNNASNNVRLTGNGGGMFVEVVGDSVQISGNSILNNQSESGGGLTVSNSGNYSITIASNAISGNMATALSGGGGRVFGGVSFFQNNVVENNVANTAGGGMVFSGGSQTISNNVFNNNRANQMGGGLAGLGVKTARIFVIGNQFDGNEALGSGGGAIDLQISDILSGEVVVEGNMFANNSGGKGGGLRFFGYGVGAGNLAMRIEGNDFVGNVATLGGSGGLDVFGARPTVRENRVVANNGFQGGGMSLAGFVEIPGVGEGVTGGYVVEDNLIAFNTGSEGGGVFVCDDCRPVLLNNNICQNQAAMGANLFNDNPAGTDAIVAENNYWGSGEETAIEAGIWHFVDDPTKGLVDFGPFLTVPAGNDPTVCDTAGNTNFIFLPAVVK